jgi:hypothetical protein
MIVVKVPPAQSGKLSGNLVLASTTKLLGARFFLTQPGYKQQVLTTFDAVELRKIQINRETRRLERLLDPARKKIRKLCLPEPNVIESADEQVAVTAAPVYQQVPAILTHGLLVLD